jgi:hypothetical protein
LNSIIKYRPLAVAELERVVFHAIQIVTHAKSLIVEIQCTNGTKEVKISFLENILFERKEASVSVCDCIPRIEDNRHTISFAHFFFRRRYRMVFFQTYVIALDCFQRPKRCPSLLPPPR